MFLYKNIYIYLIHYALSYTISIYLAGNCKTFLNYLTIFYPLDKYSVDYNDLWMLNKQLPTYIKNAYAYAHEIEWVADDCSWSCSDWPWLMCCWKRIYTIYALPTPEVLECPTWQVDSSLYDRDELNSFTDGLKLFRIYLVARVLLCLYLELFICLAASRLLSQIE